MRTLNAAGETCVWLGVLALVLASGGCGSGSSVPEGSLEIVNQSVSRDTITAVELDETYGPNFLAYDVWACPGERVCLDVYATVYDLTTTWRRGGIATHFNVRVRENCCTELCVRR